MIVDTLGNAARSAKLHPGIDRALEFLARTRVDSLAAGRHDIDGDRIYALVQDYMPAPASGKKFEAHRRYIDVQYLHRGRELIYWAPVSRLPPAPYSEEKDACLYETSTADALATPVGLDAGTFVVLFPEDAHMPGCRWSGTAGAEAQARKVVVKVLLSP